MRIASIKDMVGMLELLEDAQVEFVLLRSCFSLPKVIYLLRTVDPMKHMQLWEEFDLMIREAFNRILGCLTTDSMWAQAQLPVTTGGFGLRSAASHGVTAFIASVVGTELLQQDICGEGTRTSIDEAKIKLEAEAGKEFSKDDLVDKSQKVLTQDIDLHKLTQLASETEERGVNRDVIRLKSLSLPKIKTEVSRPHVFSPSYTNQNHSVIKNLCFLSFVVMS